MTSKNKPVLVSGIQPSGRLHIGNYLGALKNFVELQNSGKYECYFFIADLHALTENPAPKELNENILGLAADFLAAGLNAKKSLIFQQSQIPAHTELAWVFETLVTVPFLMQAHAYKDKTARGLEANAGLFNYPMLMAADILLYDTDIVPVGSDQKQHVEYAREAVTKFNNAYGELFKKPEEKVVGGGVVPGTDGEKMSKSYGNTISLFGDEEEVKKAVMGIVTDSGEGVPENVFAIHKFFKSEEELKPFYEENKGKVHTTQVHTNVS